MNDLNNLCVFWVSMLTSGIIMYDYVRLCRRTGITFRDICFIAIIVVIFIVLLSLGLYTTLGFKN